jgi:N-acetylglutamate synthase-like GNAT family acetyltransferase
VEGVGFIVRKAAEEDALAIQHFVAKTGVAAVPVVADWTSFLIAENIKGDFAAVVRIQKVSNEAGLLRTLIVDPKKITNLFILEFLEAVLHYAEKEGVETLCLLASKEGVFLEQLGFEKADKNSLPEEVSALEDVKEHINKQLPVFIKK